MCLQLRILPVPSSLIVGTFRHAPRLVVNLDRLVMLNRPVSLDDYAVGGGEDQQLSDQTHGADSGVQTLVSGSGGRA